MSSPPSPPTLWTTEPDGYLEPRLAPSGLGSKPPTTVLQLFASTAAKHATQKAMCLKRPVNGVIPADWQVWTWKQYYADCMLFAKTLLHLGVDSFHVVNILGFNSVSFYNVLMPSLVVCRMLAASFPLSPSLTTLLTTRLPTTQPEWLIANCGAQLAGCIAAGIYATNISDVRPAAASSFSIPLPRCLVYVSPRRRR